MDFFDFFGFWGVVWKFWREALGLSWEFSVGCKDSSGLVGFDYDGLHFFTFFFGGGRPGKNVFWVFLGWAVWKNGFFSVFLGWAAWTKWFFGLTLTRNNLIII